MNKELDLAWQLVQNTGCNVFLTGKAGTGKTTFLRNLCERTHKRNVVLAPTGIAAINAHGSTLHSFFQLPFGPYIPGTDVRSGERNYRFSENKRRLIRSLDLVIIDEISMVRADLLDSVDAVLRRYRDPLRPFGGVQLLLIGDLQQLAPVAKPEEWQLLQPYYATPYFFSSRALAEVGFVSVELSHVYRQSDQHFIDLLNCIRNNQVDDQVLAELNERYKPDFVPAREEGYIRLTTHNWQADQVNERELNALAAEPHTYQAEVWRDFPEMSYPTAEELVLKVGAQVMFVKNDSSIPRRYYNGMIGTVATMGDSFVKVMPQGGAELITVTAEQWENTRYNLNEETKEIEEELIGTFTQLPLKTAWAITVHKSQGLTFEHAIIDVQHSFSHGQTYVALSRCKSLGGMVLSAPIPRRAVISDSQVDAFTQHIPEQIPNAEQVCDLKRQYFVSLVADAFTFHTLRGAFDAYVRHIDEWFYRQQPDEVQEWKAARLVYEEKVERVSSSFSVQYKRMIAAVDDYAADEPLQERCRKGAAWFREQIQEVEEVLKKTQFTTRNKMVGERLVSLSDTFQEQLRLKLVLLKYIEEHGFTVEEYLRQRDLASLGPDKKKKGKGAAKSKKTTSSPARSAREEAMRVMEEELADSNSYVGECDAPYNMPDLDHDGLPY